MQENTQEIQKKEVESPAGVERTKDQKVYLPAVDIIEKSDEIVLIADLPGCDEKSVDITLEKNVLTIYGKVFREVDDGLRPALFEYGTGDYQRVFTLSNEVDKERIQAKVKNGVLTVILPKAAAAKTKKIAVVAE